MISKPSPLRAFLYSLILLRPIYAHYHILNYLDSHKTIFGLQAEGGAQKLPGFLTLAYQLYFRLTKDPRKFMVEDLIYDLELLNDGRLERMQKVEDVRTLSLRLERLSNFECGYFSFTSNPDTLVSICPNWGKGSLTTQDISFGGIWDLPVKTIYEWSLERSDSRRGVQGTDYFNNKTGYEIMDHYASLFMKEEATKITAIIERMTTGI